MFGRLRDLRENLPGIPHYVPDDYVDIYIYIYILILRQYIMI